MFNLVQYNEILLIIKRKYFSYAKIAAISTLTSAMSSIGLLNPLRHKILTRILTF